MHVKSVWLSIVLGILCSPAPGTAHTVEEEMAGAAIVFLESLSPDQRAKAQFAWEDEERMNWHFIPRERKGLSLKEMTSEQRPLAMALLGSGLSHRGFSKATTIMSLEEVLHRIEQNGRFARDPELYLISVFGTPSAEGTWGWRFEGHHLSLNFTVVGGESISGTPSFFGANPGEVRVEPRRGLRVLAEEEDLARELVRSMDAAQRAAAVISSEAPSDIITGADRKARELEPRGLSSRRMTAEQRKILSALIREYILRNRPEFAARQLEYFEGDREVYFAWAGGLEPREGHYYRIQTAGFLIEYDNTQNNANHIHAVWRDIGNDFGEDLLRKHYEEDHGGR